MDRKQHNSDFEKYLNLLQSTKLPSFLNNTINLQEKNTENGISDNYIYLSNGVVDNHSEIQKEPNSKPPLVEFQEQNCMRPQVEFHEVNLESAYLTEPNVGEINLTRNRAVDTLFESEAKNIQIENEKGTIFNGDDMPLSVVVSINLEEARLEQDIMGGGFISTNTDKTSLETTSTSDIMSAEDLQDQKLTGLNLEYSRNACIPVPPVPNKSLIFKEKTISELSSNENSIELGSDLYRQSDDYRIIDKLTNNKTLINNDYNLFKYEVERSMPLNDCTKNTLPNIQEIVINSANNIIIMKPDLHDNELSNEKLLEMSDNIQMNKSNADQVYDMTEQNELINNYSEMNLEIVPSDNYLVATNNSTLNNLNNCRENQEPRGLNIFTDQSDNTNKILNHEADVDKEGKDNMQVILEVTEVSETNGHNSSINYNADILNLEAKGNNIELINNHTTGINKLSETTNKEINHTNRSFIQSKRSLLSDDTVSNLLSNYFNNDNEEIKEIPVPKPQKPLLANALLPKGRKNLNPLINGNNHLQSTSSEIEHFQHENCAPIIENKSEINLKYNEDEAFYLIVNNKDPYDTRNEASQDANISSLPTIPKHNTLQVSSSTRLTLENDVFDEEVIPVIKVSRSMSMAGLRKSSSTSSGIASKIKALQERKYQPIEKQNIQLTENVNDKDIIFQQNSITNDKLKNESGRYAGAPQNNQIILTNERAKVTNNAFKNKDKNSTSDLKFDTSMPMKNNKLETISDEIKIRRRASMSSACIADKIIALTGCKITNNISNSPIINKTSPAVNKSNSIPAPPTAPKTKIKTLNCVQMNLTCNEENLNMRNLDLSNTQVKSPNINFTQNIEINPLSEVETETVEEIIERYKAMSPIEKNQKSQIKQKDILAPSITMLPGKRISGLQNTRK